MPLEEERARAMGEEQGGKGKEGREPDAPVARWTPSTLRLLSAPGLPLLFPLLVGGATGGRRSERSQVYP